MQLNVFFVELLGDQKLSGVLVPVVIDNRNELDEEKMSQIAKIFNSYRTVFVKNKDEDKLETRVFSTRGPVKDCLYANIATVYTLTERSYIREEDQADKEFKIYNGECENYVSISYQDMEVMSIDHKFNLLDIKVSDERHHKDYDDVLITLDSGRKTRLINTKDSQTFSKIRKSLNYYVDDNYDYLVTYYKDIIDTAFFYVHRNCDINHENRLESKNQISLILSYFISLGRKAEDINSICHVLNTGQYSIIKVDIRDKVIHSTMDSRNMVAGILNLE